MANNTLWSDNYWPLLMQLYLNKPEGVKSEYSHPMVELGIELHIPPKVLAEQMRQLDRRGQASVQRLFDTYAANPRRLARDVKRLRSMVGFGNTDMFYDGVATAFDAERTYRPVCPSTTVTPAMLVIILGLYFELTPNTMVSETPEVLDAARLMGIKPEDVVGVLGIYQTFDPILKRQPAEPTPVAEEARRTWQQYSNAPEQLAVAVGRMNEYFT